MADPNLSDLIALARRLIGDRASPPQFTDDEIAASLALSRTPLINSPLFPADDSYRVWRCYVGEIANGYTLSNQAGAVLLPSFANPLSGLFEFAEAQSAVYLTGAAFDIYRTAAALLEEWAAALALKYDFSADGATHHISQQHDNLLKQSRNLLAKSRPEFARIKRDDYQF